MRTIIRIVTSGSPAFCGACWRVRDLGDAFFVRRSRHTGSEDLFGVGSAQSTVFCSRGSTGYGKIVIRRRSHSRGVGGDEHELKHFLGTKGAGILISRFKMALLQPLSF